MFEVPVAIDKSQIAEFAKIKGKANAAHLRIQGVDYDPGHLQFCGFAGARGADKLYHGVFRFEECKEGSCPVMPFDFLEPRKTLAPKQSKGKVSNDRK